MSAYSPQKLPSLFRFVNVAGMKRSHMLGSITQSLVELKLDDEADKVPGTMITRQVRSVTAWP